MGGQTGPVFYIYYEGMRHPPPILTRKKEFDLSKRKHGPTIVPALSAKVDNKKTIHSGWKLTAPLQAVPRTQHRQPVSLFLHGHGEQRKEEFHSSTKGRKKVRDRAFQPAEAHQRAGSCRRPPFVRIPPWLYVVNLSRMETRAGRKKSHWLCLLSGCFSTGLLPRR